jgi:hypothetical protein
MVDHADRLGDFKMKEIFVDREAATMEARLEGMSLGAE